MAANDAGGVERARVAEVTSGAQGVRALGPRLGIGVLAGLLAGFLVVTTPSVAEAATTNTVYAWGVNSSGQLGTGGFEAQASPVAITLAAGVTPTAVSAGWSHSLAIGSDGNLYAWGSNANGALGDGTTISQSVPEMISLATGVTPTP